jgi:hypothetical protein
MEHEDKPMTARTARQLVGSRSRPRVAGAHHARAGGLNSGTMVGDWSTANDRRNPNEGRNAEDSGNPDDRGIPGHRAEAVAPQMVAPEGGTEPGARWRQQQLALEQERARDRGDRPTESARQAGLVGIAQAREALAEAVRRAKSRAEAKAA